MAFWAFCYTGLDYMHIEMHLTAKAEEPRLEGSPHTR